MQELVGRLTALDPEASEGLKVIAYFDALVDGHANAEVLLRGAAVLSGCAAGFVAAGTVLRVDDRGIRSPIDAAPPAGRWPEHAQPGAARAWLEREGEPHANDAMILERLSFALAIMLERSAPQAALRRAVETVLDAAESTSERQAAVTRLRLDPRSLLRVVALPAWATAPEGHQTVVVTTVGPVRAVIVAAETALIVGTAGVGVAVPPGSLHRSWETALLALRLTSPHDPVRLADELGTVLLLAEAADRAAERPPDLAALSLVLRPGHPPEPDGRTLAVLDAVVATESLRAAAAAVGLHHSTLQARVAELSQAVGFDIRTPAGRTRLALALHLHRLATTRFD